MKHFISKENLSYHFGTSQKVAARVKPYEIVTFEALDAYSGEIKTGEETRAQVGEKNKNKGGNPVTGCAYVEGVVPGDVLKITIEDIRVENKFAMNVAQGVGFLGDFFKGERTDIYSHQENMVSFAQDCQIELIPMVGTLGLATAQEIVTIKPGVHGGNMDCKDLGKGAAIYIKAQVDGGMLALGDLHGRQADGEMAICGLECDGQVDVKIEVMPKGFDLPTPFIELEDRYLCLGWGETIDQAAKLAGKNGLEFIIKQTGLEDKKAVQLMSLTTNLRIMQVVNPLMGCGAEIFKKYLPR